MPGGRGWVRVRALLSAGARVALLVLALLLLAAGVAQARVVFVHGKGYGFTLSPRARRAARPSSAGA
jgi:hypothetical protein